MQDSREDSPPSLLPLSLCISFSPLCCIQIMYKHVFRNVQFIIANKCRSCCVQHTQFKALFQLNYCQTQANCESQSGSTSVCQFVRLSASLSVRLSVRLLVCLAIGKCNCNGIGIGSGNVYLALNSEAVFHLHTLDRPLQE